MGGRPWQEEKPQRGHRYTVSPSSPPVPKQCRVTAPHEDGTVLRPKGCSSWGECRGLPAPAGAALARSTPSPGSHPRITHGTLIHHVHAAPHAQHPRAGASRHPLPPGTSSGAPSPRLQGISKFPGAERAALLLSPAEHPCTSSCCKHCLATLQHAVQAGSCRPRLGERGYVPPDGSAPS